MPEPLTTRDSATIRDGILRTERSGKIARGVPNPDVSPGSDAYVRAQSIANQLVVVEANAEASANQILPDTSTGEKFKQTCELYGVYARSAAPSVGPVLHDAVTSITITAGVNDLLVDGAGLEFTATAGVYAAGVPVLVTAKDTGSATNHDAGAILRWTNTPVGATEKAIVDVGGLVNGVDAEDEETTREFLRVVLRDPPTTGNATDVMKAARDSTASVEAAFVYPILRGPGSYGVAVTAATTATNKSRTLNGTLVSSVVAPYITGKYPEHADAVITNTADVSTDIAIAITIPEAPTAPVPGPGGGWLNGTAWPAPDGATTFKCAVTAVASTLQFTVDATTSPLAGVSQICWWSPYEDKLYRAKVTAVSGTSGAYVITIDNAFIGITAGCLISPDAVNAEAYFKALIASYAKMGPGEKTSNVSALVRGFRRPRPSVSWPYTLGAHLTRAVTEAQSEVQTAQFYYRTDGTTTINGPSGVVVPQVPGALTTPPNIYVPRHLAFYRVPS